MNAQVRAAVAVVGLMGLAGAVHAQPAPSSRQLPADQLLPPSMNSANAPSPASGKFLSTAWRQAPFASPHWSREKMVRQFVDSFKAPDQQAFEMAPTTLDRARVHALLGEPGHAGENYDLYGRLRSAIDDYRLSARNDQMYQITYNYDRKVTGGIILPEGCNLDLSSFNGAPALPAAALGKIVTGKKPAAKGILMNQKRMTIAQFEVSIGRPGKLLSSTYVAGGQAWVGYEVWWRIADWSHRYVTVSGSIPRGDWKEDKVGEETINGYSVVTLLPDCLAH